MEITKKVEGVEIEYAVNLTAQEAPGLIGGKNVISLPCLTVRVLASEWRRPLDSHPLAVRGQLVLYRGNAAKMDRDERFLEQCIELGLVEFVQGNRYTGPLEGLGTCPTPQPKDPASRTYLEGYKGAASAGEAAATKRGSGPRTHDALPRTLDALLPEPPKTERQPEWHETPLMRCKANMTGKFAEYFDLTDQEEILVPGWVAAIGNAQKSRHGEPILDVKTEWCEPGRQFRADLDTFYELHPGAKSDHPNFPAWGATL